MVDDDPELFFGLELEEGSVRTGLFCIMLSSLMVRRRGRRAWVLDRRMERLVEGEDEKSSSKR